MSRSIFDSYDELLNDIFPFGNVFSNKFEPAIEENLEEETFNIIKGNYKTAITCRFNKKGYPVSYSHISEYIPTEKEKTINQLLLEKEEAIKSQDFEKCAEIRDKLKILGGNQQLSKKGD